MNTFDIYSIAAGGNTLYAGTYNGVFYSTDNAVTWNQTSLNNESVNALMVNGTTITAGVSFNGVYISTNSGTNWTQTSLNDKDVYSLAQSSNYIFAGTYGFGIFMSSDNGQTWIPINQNLGEQYVTVLMVSGNDLYAGTGANALWKRSIAEIIGINQISSNVPSDFNLKQNYPNPFNPVTKIKYDILKSGIVKMSVYDLSGKVVRVLFNEHLSPGTYETSFDGSGFSSGVYFYKLESGSFSEVRKMTFIK